jgi:hypothetical protein
MNNFRNSGQTWKLTVSHAHHSSSNTCCVRWRWRALSQKMHPSNQLFFINSEKIFIFCV